MAVWAKELDVKVGDVVEVFGRSHVKRSRSASGTFPATGRDKHAR
jgi:hypothetical protein